MIQVKIVARYCNTCGHHEIGYIMPGSNTFVALRPGTAIYLDITMSPRVCAWCGKDLGEKPGNGETTHGICDACAKKIKGDIDEAKKTVTQ